VFESELDTAEAREPPDYQIATIALWLSRCSNIARQAKVDFESFERIRMLCDEIYEAISVRGARVGELVEALRKVRPNGSVLMDLPTMRAKPPMVPREPKE
jgi:hypothetical protein